MITTDNNCNSYDQLKDRDNYSALFIKALAIDSRLTLIKGLVVDTVRKNPFC